MVPLKQEILQAIAATNDERMLRGVTFWPAAVYQGLKQP
jgi:hypothetical protein